MTVTIEDASVITLEADLGSLVNEQGLVRMRFLIDHTPYYSGAVAGFPADRATELLEAGVAAPCDERGSPVTIGFAEPVVQAPQVAPTVTIPDGWEDLHHLARLRMAKTILNSDRSMTVDEADQIIRAELQRRERTGHG